MASKGRPRRQARNEGSTRAVAYLRVSTAEAADSGAGLAAQRETVTMEAQRRGWDLVGVHVDAGVSAKSMDRRPELAAALQAVESGSADLLVVAKLDRLSRSVVDFASILGRANGRGWGLAVLDLGVDTTTGSGKLIAHVMASVAEWERDVIGQRTKDALAIRKAEGVQLGRPATLSKSVADQIRVARDSGATLQAIADRLTKSGVPTARGGAVWRPSSVSAVLTSTSPRK